MDESTYRGPYSAIFTDIPKETLTDNLLPNVFVPNRNNSFKMMGTGLTRSQNNSFSLVCRDRLPEMWGSEKTHQGIKYWWSGCDPGLDHWGRLSKSWDTLFPRGASRALGLWSLDITERFPRGRKQPWVYFLELLPHGGNIMRRSYSGLFFEVKRLRKFHFLRGHFHRNLIGNGYHQISQALFSINSDNCLLSCQALG